jgi:ATP/maltotriose-dependent transcriptional regulator MalT
MTVTGLHLQACMNAWLHCDDLLAHLAQQPSCIPGNSIAIIEECGRICLGTLTAIRAAWESLDDVVLLCVGSCEECAELCEQHERELFKACAMASRHCSTVFSQLLLSKA